MGMFRGAMPPRNGGSTYSGTPTGPMQGRQSFGWTPARPVASQPVGSGVTNGMPGRQSFGWTPVGQAPAGNSGPRSMDQQALLKALFERGWANRHNTDYSGYRAARRGDTMSDSLTHTGAKPRDRANPFSSTPTTRPEANPRRGK